MKKLFVLFIVVIFVAVVYAFIDNAKDDLVQMEKECKSMGKNFKIKKRFNFRNGKYEEEGICY